MPIKALRYSELLRAARDRLRASATLATILGGANRVYLERDHSGRPEAAETVAWGRVMMRSTSTLWEEPHEPLAPRALGLLFRVEVNDLTDAGYDVQVPLDAAQAEIFTQINNWTPAAFTYLRVVFGFYLYQSHEPEPRFEENVGVYFNSSVFRTLVVPV